MTILFDADIFDADAHRHRARHLVADAVSSPVADMIMTELMLSIIAL